MQIQRIKTLNEIDGSGSNVITKDYFDSNPVFYYSYRIFPFERGHGIFVANSIRRFLLYEIPTIAITSVLIQTIESTSEVDPLHGFKTDFQAKSVNDRLLSEGGGEPLGSQERTASSKAANEIGQFPGSAPKELTTKLSAGPLAPGAKSSTTQLKKKKVTKKALKEQAAELFSYTSDPFAEPTSWAATNDAEVDILAPNLEANNQQSDQEISSMTEFTTIPFVRESFLEILLNLKACVFENTFAFGELPISLDGTNEVGPAHEVGNSSERSSEVLKGKLVLNASQESLEDLTEVSQELFFQTENTAGNEIGHRGRRVREYKIWAKDLILPPGLKVKNPELVLATLVAPKTNCELELSFEKIFQPDLTTLSMKTGRTPHRAEQKRRNVPIDGTLFPIKKVNFALSYTKFQKEVVTFEIWTNGGVNPRAAIFQCVEKILTLFQNLREGEVKEIDSFAETALDEFEESGSQ